MKALVVDGYNAIHKIPHLKKVMDKSLKDARGGVTKMAFEYRKKQGGIDKIYVVFDGKDVHSGKGYSQTSHQIFSKTDKGDEEVIRTVKRLKNNYHVLVVTDDNFIRNNSCAHKATVISVSEFIDTINKKHKKSPSEKRRHISLKLQEKINEELMEAWGLEKEGS